MVTTSEEEDEYERTDSDEQLGNSSGINKPVIGRPGVPGSGDLENTYERLKQRDFNKLSTSREGDLFGRRQNDSNKEEKRLRHTATASLSHINNTLCFFRPLPV